MGRKAILTVIMCILGLGMACGPTTTDPRKGGLFSYDPQAYEQRLAERRAEKQRLEAENQKLAVKQSRLEGKTGKAKAELDDLKQKLALLNEDVELVERKLGKVRAETEEQKHKLWKAQTKLKDTKRRMVQLEDSQGSPEDQAEYDQLRKRLDQLMEEADTLSKL